MSTGPAPAPAPGQTTPPPPPPAPPPPSSSATPTPPRHNYAAAHTPIASAKRSKRRTAGPALPDLGRGGGGDRAPLSPLRAVRGVPRNSHRAAGNGAAGEEEEEEEEEEDGGAPRLSGCESRLSIETEPCDGAAAEEEEEEEEKAGEVPASASWVGRKVDAIFSPVLSFLAGAAAGDASDDAAPPDASASAEDAALPPTKSAEQAEDTAAEDATTEAPEAERPPPPEGYDDGVPALQGTESSLSHAVDGDGDVAMRDERAAHGAADDTGAPEGHAAAAVRREEEDGADDEEDFNPYLFIKCLPPYRRAIPPGWASRPKALPPRPRASSASRDPVPPICLVLDLDETLVHCTVEPTPDADLTFPVEFNGTEYQVHVRCRPFLREFLEAVSGRFEVVIFTASQQVYADKLLDKIDPTGKFIRHRMFRDSCLPVEGNFLKDLTVLGRDLAQAVLVDNSPHAFGYQVDNGIPIESWFDDPYDKELLKLEAFLRTLHGLDDVRTAVRATFQTQQLVRDA